jgi:hypothetical protein
MNAINKTMNNFIRGRAGRVTAQPQPVQPAQATNANANAGGGQLPAARQDMGEFVRALIQQTVINNRSNKP